MITIRRQGCSFLVLVAVVAIVPLTAATASSSSSMMISEVADKGTALDVCNGEDWVELWNAGTTTVDLSDGSWVLYDSKGIDSEEAFRFPKKLNSNLFIVAPQAFLLLCCNADNGDDESASPQFKIGDGDVLSLATIDASLTEIDVDVGMNTITSATNATMMTTTTVMRNNRNIVIQSQVEVPSTENNRFGVTYAWKSATESYEQTSTPTPGAPNILTKVDMHPNAATDKMERLKAQNALGTAFFGMDDNGYPVSNDETAMDTVLDLHVTMQDEDYEYLIQNQSYEVYRPFQSISVRRKGSQEVLQSLSSPPSSPSGSNISSINTDRQNNNLMRIRTKGRGSLVAATCLGFPAVPFQINLGSSESNIAQTTLFGVSKFYLRNHMADFSYMRDWSTNIMLARFGLPFLRTRKVRFYVNGYYKGLYEFMEAVDQEYVFARNFPSYNPDQHALFKFKMLSRDCGTYNEEQLAQAQERLAVEDDTEQPYLWERGEHRPKTQVLEDIDACVVSANQLFDDEFKDLTTAYLRYNRDCPAMLLGEGLVERDFGTKDYDSEMESLLKDHLACGEDGCDETLPTQLSDKVDLENFLKSFVVLAVLLKQDSPMGNANNYFLIETGEGKGWQMMLYDHNAAGDSSCHTEGGCNEKLIYWNIASPTCGPLDSNPIVGPILKNPEYHQQYLEYVREFTNDILGNASWFEEMARHAEAIEEDVKDDAFSVGGILFFQEKSPTAAAWNYTTSPVLPLLPLLSAREAEVKLQLAALDDGTFPRGPHRNVSIEDWETCPDWRLSSPPETKCDRACVYEGCHEKWWPIPSYCDEEIGTCYHGVYDFDCLTYAKGQRYAGMQDREDGRATFCWGGSDFRGAVKASECPPFNSSLFVESAAPATVPSLILIGTMAAVVLLLSF